MKMGLFSNTVILILCTIFVEVRPEYDNEPGIRQQINLATDRLNKAKEQIKDNISKVIKEQISKYLDGHHIANLSASLNGLRESFEDNISNKLGELNTALKKCINLKNANNNHIPRPRPSEPKIEDQLLCTKPPFDLYFVMQHSLFVDTEEMQNAKKAVEGFKSKLQYLSTGSRIGFILYNWLEAKIVEELKSLENVDVNAVFNQIADGPNSVAISGRKVSEGISIANQELMKAKSSSNKSKIIVVIARGKQDKDEHRAELSEVRANKFSVYTISVGDGVNWDRLQNIATNSSYATAIKSHTILLDTLGDIICS